MSARAGALPALALAVATAGCASDKLTLLENEEGAETGAVAVIDEKRGKEVLVDKPLTEAKLSSRPAPRAVKQLRPKYNRLLGGLPPPAKRFELAGFAMGEARLTPEMKPTLDLIRDQLVARPGAVVEVVGHTDTVDDEERNDQVSLQRAEAVVQALIAEGFPAEILSATGRGERELKVPTDNDVSNEQNRRVEVVVR